MEVKFTYEKLGSFDMANLMSKLENTPTHNKNASHIHQFTKRYKQFCEKMKNDYMSEIHEVYGKKGIDGKSLPPSAENPNGFDLIEGKEEEFKKAQEDFGKREVVFKGESPNPSVFKPLTPLTLADVKMTAKEIDMLGGLYSAEEGPGVPDNVLQIGKK